jgi:hypothetical protein
MKKASPGDRHRRDWIAIAQAGLATTLLAWAAVPGKKTGCRPDPISVLATLRRRLRARLLPEEAGLLQQPAVGGVNSR